MPKPAPESVRRTRMLDLLSDGLDRRVVSLCSPSGFGKTSAVAAWCHENRDSCLVSWLSLDAGDNEISRFAAYFVSSINQAVEKLGADTLAAACSGQARELEPLFTRVLSDLGAIRGGTNQKPWVIVLDDYHLIDSPEIHGALKLFMRHVPQLTTTIVISRTEPDLGFSFLRAAGEILEFGERELGFDEKEAMEFFRARLPFPVNAQLVRQALEKLEGWAAGLQLMCLSVSDVGTFQQMAEQFTGRERHVFDYLAENVLAQLPQDVKEFLLFTSVLDRFDADLAARVSGADNTRRILMRLEKHHLFIVPLDRERTWYRYHHLFSDFLRHQLRLDFPGRLADLQRRACRAWLDKGDPDEAARHALNTGSADEILRVVDLVGWQLFEQGKLMLITCCLDAVSPQDCARSGEASLLQAFRAIDLDRSLDDMEPWLERAERMLPQHMQPQEWSLYEAYFSAIRALNGALAVKDTATVEAQARHALAHLAPGEVSMRGCALCALGVVKLDHGELDDALAILRESQMLAESIGAVQMAIRSLHLQIYLRMSQGEFNAAQELQDAAVALCNQYCAESRATLDLICQSRAWLHWELLELDRAESLCQEALRYRKEVLKFPINTQLSFIRLVQGDLEGAEYFARQNDLLMQKFNCRRRWLCDHDEVRVSLWARRNRRQDLLAWLEAQPDFEKPVNLHLQALARTRARALIALDRCEEADAILAVMIEAAAESGLLPDESRAHAWRAVALAHQDDAAGAKSAMVHALVIGARCRCIGSLLEAAEFLLPVLQDLVAGSATRVLAGDARKLCKQLLRYAEQWTRSKAPDRSNRIPESARAAELTRKEWQVLSLIGEGLTNTQIAQRLFISPGTVKCHINRLYHKLDISSREMAIRRANSLKDPYEERRRAI